MTSSSPKDDINGFLVFLSFPLAVYRFDDDGKVEHADGAWMGIADIAG